ncbi:phosphopantetheine-binding protein [Nocardia sp. NPDC051321]|uniref:phosphopantetheine-binding protein n=1 Tax=Nocardia sp. NPDC051321 TaxID=3364323 RepID=UPI00378FFC64
MSSSWDDAYESLLRRHLRRIEPAMPLPPHAAMADLGLDSMEAIQLLLEVEDLFDVSIPDELLTADTFATPGSLWSVVVELQMQQRL